MPPGLRNDVIRKSARRLYYKFAIDDAVKRFCEMKDPLNAVDVKFRVRQARLRTDVCIRSFASFFNYDIIYTHSGFL